jgi:hypothetical protein
MIWARSGSAWSISAEYGPAEVRRQIALDRGKRPRPPIPSPLARSAIGTVSSEGPSRTSQQFVLYCVINQKQWGFCWSILTRGSPDSLLLLPYGGFSGSWPGSRGSCWSFCSLARWATRSCTQRAYLRSGTSAHQPLLPSRAPEREKRHLVLPGMSVHYETKSGCRHERRHERHDHKHSKQRRRNHLKVETDI